MGLFFFWKRVMRRDVFQIFFSPPVCLIILPVRRVGTTHEPVGACCFHTLRRKNHDWQKFRFSPAEKSAQTRSRPSLMRTSTSRLAALFNLWNRRSDFCGIVLKLQALAQLQEVTSIASTDTTRGLHLSNTAFTFIISREETTGFLQLENMIIIHSTSNVKCLLPYNDKREQHMKLKCSLS